MERRYLSLEDISAKNMKNISETSYSLKYILENIQRRAWLGHTYYQHSTNASGRHEDLTELRKRGFEVEIKAASAPSGVSSGSWLDTWIISWGDENEI